MRYASLLCFLNLQFGVFLVLDLNICSSAQVDIIYVLYVQKLRNLTSLCSTSWFVSVFLLRFEKKGKWGVGVRGKVQFVFLVHCLVP